jgi:hypothetical protein
MSNEDTAGELLSSVNDVELTKPPDDTTYWVGAISDTDLLHLGSDNMDRAP